MGGEFIVRWLYGESVHDQRGCVGVEKKAEVVNTWVNEYSAKIQVSGSDQTQSW